MVQDYYNLEELDRPTLVRLIKKIEVGEKRMVDGTRNGTSISTTISSGISTYELVMLYAK